MSEEALTHWGAVAPNKKKIINGFPTKKQSSKRGHIGIINERKQKQSICGILQWHFVHTEIYESGSESTVFVPTWETEKNKRRHRFWTFLLDHNPEKKLGTKSIK